jgi:hypothetical protein
MLLCAALLLGDHAVGELHGEDPLDVIGRCALVDAEPAQRVDAEEVQSSRVA